MALHEHKTNYGVIAYDKRGMGDPLILLHGIYAGASYHEYAHNIPALQRHYTVYAIDLLGFGQSDTPRMGHTAQMHQHLLRGFIHDVIGQRAHIIASGMSCGIAVRLGVYEDPLVNRMVLLAPTQKSQYKEEPGLSDRLTQFLLGTLSAGFSVYETAARKVGIIDFLKSNLHDPSKITAEQVEQMYIEANEPNKMMPFISALCGYFDTDLANWMKYVRAATQIIVGADLMPIPEHEWLHPAQWSQGRQLDVIDKAKAFPHQEQSARVNELMLAFLE